MDLILWRHAHAAPAAPGEDDAGRPLTDKGRKQAAAMAHWLAQQLPARCRILSSPAARCVQTAEALERTFRTEAALASDSTAEALLACAGWPAPRGPVLLVGHQPLLGQAAALVLCGRQEPWLIRKGQVFWIGRKDAQNAPFIRAAIGPDLVRRLRGQLTSG